MLSLSSNDRVLLFGISENPINQLDPNLTALFGYSRNDRFELDRPDETARFLYFEKVISHILKSPADFPKDPTARAKRQLPELERVPPPPPRQLTKAEKRDIAQKDRLLKNQLKIRLRPLMEDLKFKYKRFKKSVIDHDVVFRILAREVQVEGPHPPKDPNAVESDIQVVSKDRWNPYFEDDVLRVEDKETKKIYYNIDLDKVEERYSNGHYCTPQQFLLDLERIRHDAKLLGEKENQLKANEMLTNAEVYIAEIEAADTAWIASLEDMYRREQRKTAEMLEEAKKQKQEQERERLRIQEAAETGASQNHTAEEEEGGEPRDVPNIAPPKTPAPRQLSNGASEEEQHSHHTRDSDYPLYNTPGHHVTAVSTQFTQISAGAGGHVGVARIAPAETSMVLNDASTTTSGGKRTSDATTISQPQTASQPNSNPFSNHSNGFPGPSPTIDHPGVWGLFGVPVKGDSQLASTQLLVSSQEESQGGLQTTPAQNPPTYSDSRNLETTPVHRQHPPPQPILDSSPANKVFVIPPPAGPKLVCDAARVEEVHELLAKRTTGYSVEQLEQVNAAIMDCVWKSRMNYNRNEVATKVVEAFEEVEKDVKTLQSLMAASGSFE